MLKVFYVLSFGMRGKNRFLVGKMAVFLFFFHKSLADSRIFLTFALDSQLAQL